MAALKVALLYVACGALWALFIERRVKRMGRRPMVNSWLDAGIWMIVWLPILLLSVVVGGWLAWQERRKP